MLLKILADIVVFVHFIWIIFLLFGAVLGVRNKIVRIFHISGLAFALIIQIFSWYCPLTHLEVWLREQQNPSLNYTGSFIIHYIERIVYIELSRTLIFVLSIFLCVFNAWIYSRKKKK